MSIFELAQPLFKHVSEVQESLSFSLTVHSDKEALTYGTREKNYHLYRLEAMRNGKSVGVVDYLNSKLNELQTIREGAYFLEEKTGNKLFSIYNEILNCQIAIESELQSISNTETLAEPSNQIDAQAAEVGTITKKQGLSTYVWQGNTDEVTELYERMVNRFIPDSNSINDFKLLFSGVDVSDLTNKIIWKSDNATELLYFIIKLEEHNLISKPLKTVNYKQIKACFIKSTGLLFNEAFKSLKTDIEIRISKASKLMIDNLINDFG